MVAADASNTGQVSRFAGTLIDLLDRVTYRRVGLSEQFDPVYRLRYEAYRREQFVPINSQRVTVDPFDASPNVYCYGCYIDGALVSSIRFHHVTPGVPDSPGRSVWPEVLDPVLAAGDSYIDPSRFTADHEASLAYPALPFLTLRIVVMAAIHFGARYVLSAVRPEHGAFYKRVFNSTQHGAPRNFAELTFPMVLYLADVPVIKSQVFSRFPFFRSTHEERVALFEGPRERAVRPSVRLAQPPLVAAE